jgi:hypothetical protein
LASWRPGTTRGRRPSRTTFGWAVTAQQSCAPHKDRHAGIEGRVRGARLKEKWAFEKPILPLKFHPLGQFFVCEPRSPSRPSRPASALA